MTTKTLYPTGDAIVVPVPKLLVAEFLDTDAFTALDRRGTALLQLGRYSLGLWRIDGIASQIIDDSPRMIATLRKMYGSEV